MRATIGVFVALFVIPVGFAAPPLRPRALACAPQTVGCNDVILGELGVGDCTLDDGTYADLYELDSAGGQLVAATVRPLSAGYTKPSIFLLPPPGNASKTPVTIGGAAGTVWYRIQSPGTWNVLVGSTNLFSAGAYALDTYCEPDPTPGQCIVQDLLCNQSQSWSLTSQSCRFNSAPDLLYQTHSIYGVAGDTITIEMLSDDFRPLFGIYDDDGRLLDSSASLGSGGARLTYRFPTTGFYDINATARDDRSVGLYVLNVSCSKSGCLYPLITHQPTHVEVAYGERATLSLDVHHVGPVEYRWYEFRDFPELRATTTTPQWETDPITTDRVYTVTADSPCGAHDSEPILVSPKATRRRSVRK